MDDAPRHPHADPAPPSDPRLATLLLLRDELQALNARLEYAALMLRLAKATPPK
jgi:hypothetical protein